MQTFNIEIGKTKAELQAITEKTDLGAVTYDPQKKILYENEWHTIEPTNVIKPEIDGAELDYYNKTEILKKNSKYCAQIYWKAGLIITDGTTSDMATPKKVINKTNKYIAGSDFNIESGLVDSIFYTRGRLDAFSGFMSTSFAISEELAQILDVTDIRATLAKMPSLQRAEPTVGTDYLYSGVQSYSASLNSKSGFNIMSSSPERYITGTPSSTLFGHCIAGIYSVQPLVTVSDGGDQSDEIILKYQQPENTSDSSRFYSFSVDSIASTAPDYIKTYYPQALPIGVPMVIVPNFITTNSDPATNLATLTTPFIFYMLGITEIPAEEA